ncbi:NAD(P)/FAD-dependent oxidoreductase [Pseudooceanicola algae]|uniref:D-amino acid dehydrogenase 1 n=1 Tax=Pseudooceanicola algae TaxID=1537215 RepID=A0A7T1FR01_9RHOB|nr:FAD-dependent oxidoreductase [Pseudooceanicola algae]QPM92501.1 D-amino acid dehydrogenase 1 [Pseudooceanicola algae]
MTTEPTEIIVIGAGIIGVTAALALRREGHVVRLLDRKGVAAETSRGNAGAFAFPEVEPISAPRIMRKAPKWLIDPLGPLAIRPGHALKIAPWMLQFWRNSRPDRFEATIAVQSGLMDHSRAALERLVPLVDGEALLRRDGQLQLYEGRASFEASLPSWDRRRRLGIDFSLFENRDAIAELQPGLNARFTHAGFTPDWLSTVDPALWTEHLAQAFVAAGGIIETADIRALRQDGNGVEVDTAEGPRRAAQVVLAAGAWSHKLARSLGDRIPLEAERGYNTSFASANVDVRMHLTFGDHGFVISRLGDGIRVGGAVELGGLTLPPNYRRAEILVEKAKAFLDGFDPQGGKQWMGYRPSLPDSLPVIARAPRADRVIYAFGHGHLGLTQSAGTAELVADLVARRDPRLALAPFDVTRF